MLRNISDFCPIGIQVRSPGGLSFDLKEVISMEATGGRDGYLVINMKGGASHRLTFHSSSDGGVPDIYGLKRNIEREINGDAD